jgi:hypothetical protein
LYESADEIVLALRLVAVVNTMPVNTPVNAVVIETVSVIAYLFLPEVKEDFPQIVQ